MITVSKDDIICAQNDSCWWSFAQRALFTRAFGQCFFLSLPLLRLQPRRLLLLVRVNVHTYFDDDEPLLLE